MPYDVRRFAMFVGGLMCLVLPASAAEAQTRPHRFEIAAGTMYGFQDPERPVTAGWIVSSGFDLGRRSFVVEGAWHRDAYALEHPWTSTRCSARGFRAVTGCCWAASGAESVKGAWRRTTKSWPVASRPVSGGTTSAGVDRHRDGEHRVRRLR